MMMHEDIISPSRTHMYIFTTDEAHERSLQTDILFGLIRRAQNQRPDLHIVVMSATLEVDTFKKFFGSEEVGRKPTYTSHVIDFRF